MENFELRNFIQPLLKWWWLLVGAALIAGLSSVVYLVQQPDNYESRTSLMVGSFIQDPNPSGQDIYLTQQLADTYADFVQRYAVRQATMEALGMTWLPYYSAYAQGQLLEIVVTAFQPELAQAVASELANQVIQQGPAGRAQGDRQAFVEQRLKKLEEDISATEDEIERKQEELANELSASKIRRLETDINTLANKVSTLESTYSELLGNSLRGAANSVYVFESAGYPQTPISKGYATYALVSIVFGLALAGAGAYLIEYLDDSFKTTSQVQQYLDLPTLGAIPDLDIGTDRNESRLIMVEDSRLPAAESYRILRTNLQFASVDQELTLLQITSASPGEGKSITAANLSAALAQTGKQVVLVDADFRRPVQHKLFGLSNSYGMTLALLEQTDSIDALIQNTTIPNLRVLTAGPLPPNPAELLASKRMQDVFARLRKETEVVVIDSPPVTVVSDAAIISSYADGVLLVLRAGRTRKEYAKRSLEALRQVDAKVLGAILNSVSKRDSGYHYAYGYDYGYGYSYEADAPASSRQKRSRRSGASAVNVLLGRKHNAAPAVGINGSQRSVTVVEPGQDTIS